MVAEKKCFPSLLSLRVTHSELLKRHQARGDEPETLKLIESFIHKGKATGAIIDNEEERWLAQGFLDYWSAILYRAGHEPPEATLCDFEPQLAPSPDDSQCPYIGLKPYREAEHALLCGRKSLVGQLIQTADRERLLLVTGSSGVGKTSVIFGGFLPKLRARTLPNRHSWLHYSWMAPGSRPFEALARLLCQRRVDKEPLIPRLTQYLQQDPNHLNLVLGQIGQGKPAILVIDQFEELFTLCHDTTTRQIFVDSLLQLIKAPEPQYTVIIILQSEYESRLVEFPKLTSACKAARIPVTSPSALELHTMITEPADLVGLKFESGVVDALIQDILREPECLPLLQVILTGLWEKRDRNRITWQHYQEVGRGRHALVQQAEQCFAELSPDEQAIARQIMLGLVQLGKGMNLVKRRIPRSLLAEIAMDAQVTGPLQTGSQVQNIDHPDIVTTATSNEPEGNPETAQQLMDALIMLSEPPPVVQQRFKELLQERITTDSERQPPLFPWETTLAKYPIDLSETVPQPWLAQLRSLQLPTALPEQILSKLLERCQELLSESLKPGVQLVKAVESLFPAQAQTMNYVAGAVLAASVPTRGATTRITDNLKATFPKGYEGASPQQQIALTMLVAKDILDNLTLALSTDKPSVQHEWLTTEGKLHLKAMLVGGDRLRVLGQLPSEGSIRIHDSDQGGFAQRDSPGLLLVELNHSQTNQSYPIEVSLTDLDKASLIFSVSVLSSQS